MVRIDLDDLSTSYGLRNAYLGEKPMSAIIVGDRSVSVEQVIDLDGNFGAPKNGSVLIPEWATTVAYVVSGAGKGGEDGDGGFGGSGRGGTGGQFTIGWRSIDPDGRNLINYSLGGGYASGRNGDSSSITLSDGLVVEAQGGITFGTSQGGAANTHQATDVGQGQSADDWLTRLKVSRNSNDGARYRPGTGGGGNAGSGVRGGGGAGGNGGIFGNYTRGGFGGPGYVRLVFWGFDRTVYSRSHEMIYKPNDQVFLANLAYEVPGGDSKGLKLPQENLSTLEHFEIYYPSEYISYLDDYTFGIRKMGGYYISVTNRDPDTGMLTAVDEISITIKNSAGEVKAETKVPNGYAAADELGLDVGDVIVPSVRTTDTEKGEIDVTINFMYTILSPAM